VKKTNQIRTKFLICIFFLLVIMENYVHSISKCMNFESHVVVFFYLFKLGYIFDVFLPVLTNGYQDLKLLGILMTGVGF